MKRLTLCTICLGVFFLETWCLPILQHQGEEIYPDSINSRSFFQIDDSLLRISSPESYNRMRRAGVVYDTFSHIQKLHYTPNNPVTPHYLIITTPLLYDSLRTDIITYAEDVHAIYGYGIYLEVVDNPNPEQLKSLIIDCRNNCYQNNLCGVMFIGSLGEAYYEIENDHGKHGYQNWPCDLYFMDLNGNWIDSDNNGIYDQHTGDVAPEIFLARLSVQGLSAVGEEIPAIRKQLRKSHDFWWKADYNVSDKALCYIDDDWCMDYRFPLYDLNPIYGPNNIVNIRYCYTSSPFSPSDYLTRLSQNVYGFTLLASHSNPILHQFTNGDILISDILNNNSGCYLFNLFCCCACNWTSSSNPNYIGGAYLFNNGKTIAVVGTTKIGGMCGGNEFYSQFPSKNVGESFLYWWKTHCGNSHDNTTVYWHYGMTILGDPTIRLAHKVSDVCVNDLVLTSYPYMNLSNLVIFRAASTITVSDDFFIPQGVHVIFDAPQVIFEDGFTCPVGSSIETRHEGCEL